MREFIRISAVFDCETHMTESAQYIHQDCVKRLVFPTVKLLREDMLRECSTVANVYILCLDDTSSHDAYALYRVDALDVDRVLARFSIPKRRYMDALNSAKETLLKEFQTERDKVGINLEELNAKVDRVNALTLPTVDTSDPTTRPFFQDATTSLAAKPEDDVVVAPAAKPEDDVVVAPAAKPEGDVDEITGTDRSARATADAECTYLCECCRVARQERFKTARKTFDSKMPIA